MKKLILAFRNFANAPRKDKDITGFGLSDGMFLKILVKLEMFVNKQDIKPFRLNIKLPRKFYTKPGTKLYRNGLSNFGDKTYSQTGQDFSFTH